MIHNITVTPSRQVFADVLRVPVTVLAEFGPYEPSAVPATATVLRQLAAELAEYADQLDADPSAAVRRDAAMVERIDDDRRILLALTTEARRLRKLGAQPGEHRLDHTERLIRVYSDRVADFPTPEGRLCPCVTLPSGKIYPCQWHSDEPATTAVVFWTLPPIELALPLDTDTVRVTWNAEGVYTIELNPDEDGS